MRSTKILSGRLMRNKYSHCSRLINSKYWTWISNQAHIWFLEITFLRMSVSVSGHVDGGWVGTL